MLGSAVEGKGLQQIAGYHCTTSAVLTCFLCSSALQVLVLEGAVLCTTSNTLIP